MFFVRSEIAPYGMLPAPSATFADLTGFKKQYLVAVCGQFLQSLHSDAKSVEIEDVVMNRTVNTNIEVVV